MAGLRFFVGAASLAAGLAAAGLSVAQPTAPRGISAHAFAQEAAALRARAAVMGQQAQALGAAATAEAQAQQLRSAALTQIEADLLAAETALQTASGAVADRRDALAGLVMGAWFAQRAGADQAVRAALRLTGAHVASEAAPAQAAFASAETRAARLRAAQVALTSAAEAGGARIEQHEMAMAALSVDHGAVLDRLALSEERARLLRADPGAAGTPAPRLAAALFGPGGARVVLGRSSAQPGVTFAGAPGQPVVAPESGRIRFAGAYRSYGQVLVLELDSGYAVVFAGLEGMPSPTGGAVSAGGLLGSFSSNAAVAPELYVEVRRSARPVDPERAARTWRIAVVEPPASDAVILASSR